MREEKKESGVLSMIHRINLGEERQQTLTIPPDSRGNPKSRSLTGVSRSRLLCKGRLGLIPETEGRD